MGIKELQWKVSLCNSGESCWCRVIETVENIGDVGIVVSDGAIGKEEAEYIVELHNRRIKNESKK